ncbi:MarC family protein [Tanticharoenia sakaeratensis]|uniref:UPF0056 membrane protein n=1 Tax=Tanticharoenia sakaeratensis NBRC 103193 TaxID=1231623 RepID=A0A0D6MJU2_9PROT|nr:MarC family protein [Tanticharoenia sakaeratensis]GAN53892.1 hypothetical protein Tasa_012_068 [Tanticharoenia sakaeratensis NBRC 103193]GBQ25188.1 multiple antibiotic resistance protein MarC [Tanticharoenia sakaeratensis NBRC 103193]
MIISPHGLTQQIGARNVLAAFLLAFPALFSIVNPLGAALIFAQATLGRSRRECVTLARLVALNSFIILIVSIWFGEWILGFFGITIDALRVTGGLVVAVRAWALLQEPEEIEARKERQALQEGRTTATADLRQTAFFPLAMPFTVGPGSISVAIALSSERPASDPMPSYYIGLTLASTAIAFVVAGVYAYADRVVAMLGSTGTRIVSRLAALILLCIGIQILFSGLHGFVLDLARDIRLDLAPAPTASASR